jgi:hypothetical protein
LQQLLRLGVGGGLPHEGEIIALSERGDEAAGERPLIGGAERGRQVLRVGVDGEAEEQELHQRDPDHDAESHAVAHHLDELLEHDSPEPM